MDEDTKEQIFITAAIANIIALFFMAIPYFVNYVQFLDLIPAEYRIYLIFLLLFLVFTMLKILDDFRVRKYPVSIKADTILYTIKDSTGKSVHCEKNQLIRANHDFITIYDDEIITDGTFGNIEGTVEGIESTIVPAPKKEGKTWYVQHVFSRPLPKKYVMRTFSFDFIDSFTENHEYILCHVENDIKDFQIAVIFPIDRPPKEVKGYLKRRTIEIEKQRPPIRIYDLPDKRKRVDWQINHPKIDDIYKITWKW